MGRYPTTQPQPGQETDEGDDHFVGMIMEQPGQERSILQPGYYPLSQNGRTGTQRRGSVIPAFANIVAFGAILGSGVYNNPNGNRVIMIATPNDVLMIREGSYPTSVPIPAGVTLELSDPAGWIEFSQDFDKLYLEGASCGTLVWNGISSSGFVPIQQSSPADTTRRITPAVPWSVNFSDRRIFLLSGDELGVSDLGDYTSYDYLLDKFRVNKGTADPIVGVYPFAKDYLLVGKEESWDVVAGFSGSLDNASMQLISSTLGIAARRACTMAGGDRIFLCKQGVYRITQVIEDRLQASPVPVAAKQLGGRVVDPIAPLLKRINWAAKAGFVARDLAPYCAFAFAIDGSPVNNALAWYNSVSDEWEGFDTWDPAAGMQIDNLLVADYLGRPHLYAINHGTQSIHVLGEGHWDVTPNGQFEIDFIFESRGYATLGWNAATGRDAKRMEIGLRSWRPSITVTQLSESTDDERTLTLTPITRDRRKYFTWGRPNYDTSNANDDFQTPGREDYSVTLADAPIYLGSGIKLEQTQERTERFALKARSRWTGFRIENKQGQCDILGILYESSGVQKQTRRAA